MTAIEANTNPKLEVFSIASFQTLVEKSRGTAKAAFN